MLGETSSDGDVTLQEVTYAAVRGSRITATLVRPAGAGPFPAILYSHGSGQGREAFREEAVAMARRGAVSLLPDAPWARAPFERVPTLRVRDRAVLAQGVIELRRALDVLESLPYVDASRIGYVGFSMGALQGGTLSGVERRIDAYVLVAGSASWSSRQVAQARATMPRKRADAYLAAVRQLDPVYYVGRAAPAALFTQNGRRDRFFPRGEVVALQRAASSPKLARWYDGGHDPGRLAAAERADWLAGRLGLS